LPRAGDNQTSNPWICKVGAHGPEIQLRIRLTPKSSRDVIDGCAVLNDGPALKARVRAVPENGAANKALITLLAKSLNLPKSSISLSAGGKSRTKFLTIIPAGQNETDRITTRIDELLSQ
jgi:uncharacterized protein YggU (UPF0235/DUF167 family)